MWNGCENKMAAKLRLSRLQWWFWSSGCAGFRSRGEGGSEADSDISDGVELACLVCGRLVQPRWTGGSSFDVGGWNAAIAGLTTGRSNNTWVELTS